MSSSCGNPLLAAWLKEWWDDARERNSKGILTYKKAYQSMSACPIAFSHPSEAVQLHGLGPKLCDRLTKKLEEYCQQIGLPIPQAPSKNKKHTNEDILQNAPARPAKKARAIKAYVPALRSGPYALVIALATLPEGSSRGLTKSELIELAQPHCDSSFSAPSDPTKFYTAWNSIKTLQNKDLVYEHGRPTRRYALTEEGWEVAKRMSCVGRPDAAQEEIPDEELREVGSQSFLKLASSSRRPASPTGDIVFIDEEEAHAEEECRRHSEEVLSLGDIQARQADPSIAQVKAQGMIFEKVDGHKRSFVPLQIPAGSFSVELVLDTREVRSKTDQTYIQNSLVNHGIVPTTRALPLGDALWVARLKPEFSHLLQSVAEDGSKPTEILLGHIAERKRLDDLIGSIKDGRFHEQKFRLRRSGIPNVVYLIEDMTMAPEVVKRTSDMVTSAIAGTMLVSGFFVKRTRKLDDSISYLARMTRALRRRFEGKGLAVLPDHALNDGKDVTLIRNLLSEEKLFMTFDAFASLAGKSDALTLRDVFLKMLMCTKGITGDKAIEIQRRWNTPHAFIKALRQEDESDEGMEGRRRKEMVFKVTGQLVGRKKIGKAVSSKVGDVWGEAAA